MTDYLATGGWLPGNSNSTTFPSIKHTNDQYWLTIEWTGTVTPSGLALFLIMVIMGTFSHRIVRRSGRFEVIHIHSIKALMLRSLWWASLLRRTHAENKWMNWRVAGILLDAPVVHSFLRFVDATRNERVDVDGDTARSLHARVDMSLRFHLFRSRTHSHHLHEHATQPGIKHISALPTPSS